MCKPLFCFQTGSQNRNTTHLHIFPPSPAAQWSYNTERHWSDSLQPETQCFQPPNGNTRKHSVSGWKHVVDTVARARGEVVHTPGITAMWPAPPGAHVGHHRVRTSPRWGHHTLAPRRVAAGGRSVGDVTFPRLGCTATRKHVWCTGAAHERRTQLAPSGLWETRADAKSRWQRQRGGGGGGGVRRLK